MIEPDGDGYDEPWTDGHKPHPACGHYVEEHTIRLTPHLLPPRQWVCPID